MPSRPLYAEASDRDCVAAWLERDGRYLPLKRIINDLDPVVLPGAPTTGPAAAHAREIAERLEDVRVAVAVLAGAAEQAEIAIDMWPHTNWSSLLPSRAWAEPAIAALKPLRQIIESGAEFEDAVSRVCEEKRPSEAQRPLTGLELPELERVGLDDGRAAGSRA